MASMKRVGTVVVRSTSSVNSRKLKRENRRKAAEGEVKKEVRIIDFRIDRRKRGKGTDTLISMSHTMCSDSYYVLSKLSFIILTEASLSSQIGFPFFEICPGITGFAKHINFPKKKETPLCTPLPQI